MNILNTYYVPNTFGSSRSVHFPTFADQNDSAHTPLNPSTLAPYSFLSFIHSFIHSQFLTSSAEVKSGMNIMGFWEADFWTKS